MLTTEECDALKDDMYEIERVWRETGELPEVLGMSEPEETHCTIVMLSQFVCCPSR